MTSDHLRKILLAGAAVAALAQMPQTRVAPKPKEPTP